MHYDFECPNCGLKVDIEMKISEYHSDNHFCPECNTELQRDPSSLVCSASIDRTNSFYRKIN